MDSTRIWMWVVVIQIGDIGRLEVHVDESLLHLLDCSPVGFGESTNRCNDGCRIICWTIGCEYGHLSLYCYFHEHEPWLFIETVCEGAALCGLMPSPHDVYLRGHCNCRSVVVFSVGEQKMG